MDVKKTTSDNLHEVLSTLTNFSDQLSRKTSKNDCIQHFIDTLNQFFMVYETRVFELIQSTDQRFELNNIVLSGQIEKSENGKSQILDSLGKSLLAVPFKDHEFKTGTHTLKVKDKTWTFCVLGDVALECRVLAWRMRIDSKQSSWAVNLCDHLVSQVRSSFKWMQKLGKTEDLIYRDDLTGVFNARYLEDALDSEFRRAERFHGFFSLLFIDLDKFKSINDKSGHLCGSDVLKQLADLLTKTVRDIDSVIRYGGDEFVVLLLGTSPSSAVLAGERIRKIVAANTFENINDQTPLKLTCSIGVASYPEHAKTKKSLLKIADDCMYQSKRSGRNRVTLFESSKADELPNVERD